MRDALCGVCGVCVCVCVCVCFCFCFCFFLRADANWLLGCMAAAADLGRSQRHTKPNDTRMAPASPANSALAHRQLVHLVVLPLYLLFFFFLLLPPLALVLLTLSFCCFPLHPGACVLSGVDGILQLSHARPDTPQCRVVWVVPSLPAGV